MPRRRCFILGAGFSRCCGLPLARELTPVVWRSLAKQDPADASANPPLRQPGDFGYEAVETNVKAIRLLFPSHQCDAQRDDTWPDFEQVITALDEAARYQRSFERISHTTTHNWAEQAKHWLMHHLQERLSELTESSPTSGLQAIKDFLGQLDLQQDAIISFNWDVLLEVVAADLNLAIRYRDDQGDGLRLAKPHGSLNLVDSPVTEYEKARGAINVHSLDTEFEYEDGESRIVLRAQNPKDSWLRQAWAKERLLIEPNIRKLYDNRWIELQWVRALQVVRTADQLIVIGFSLPKPDLRPRILLQLSHLHRPAPRLQLVAPDADRLCDHYRRLTGLKPEPFPGTLEDWLKGRRTAQTFGSRVGAWIRRRVERLQRR